MKITSKAFIFLITATIFSLVVFVVVFSSRTNKNVDENNDYETGYIPETILFDDVISDPVYEGMPDGVSYRCISTRKTTDTKTGSRLVMNYPVFSGFGEADETINEIIVYHNEEMKKIHGNGMEKMLGWNIKVIYEIRSFFISYIDNDLLSIVYDGVFSSFSENDHIDTGNYYFKYSVNIDLKNKKILTSDELISNYLLMKSNLVAGNMKVEYAIEDLFKYSTYYEMLIQYGDTYKNYPMLYFTKDKVNIIISLTPDLGGHAVFSYNINDSMEFINSDLASLQGLFF